MVHLKNKNVIQKIKTFQILKIVTFLVFSIQLSCQIDDKVLVYKFLQKFLLSSDVVVLILHHLRHGFIAIVVQRTISVSEVVLEACQVNFMAYVKCQCNGN